MDPSHTLLACAANGCEGPALLVADENCAGFPFPSLKAHVQVLSNRADIAAQAERAGLKTAFSDFDFTPWRENPPRTVLYRLSKEKPVVHHIANQSCDLLPAGGTLVLFGGKQEGIKTFAKTIGQRLGSDANIVKHGMAYEVTIQKGPTPGAALDDRDYPRLREISTIGGKPVYSKPGIFGWDKIDEGSALLAEFLPAFLPVFLSEQGGALLDLGCGYGYLSLMAAQQGKFTITATDNCAAAVIACQRNFSEHRIDGVVVADDCASSLEGRFDLILCNPPFHQGFREDRALTEKFLATTRRLLKPGGRALFVVNQFVPLENLARAHFARTDIPKQNGSFKLVILS